MAANTLQKRSIIKNKRERSRLFFYVVMFAIPLIQFAVFYVYVNFNSILMSFQRNVPVEGGLGYVTNWVGFDNFKIAANFLFSSQAGQMIVYSLIYFAFNLFIITPLGLLFSFYIARKYHGSEFFRVMLYLPSVLSSIVLAILFHHMITDVIPFISKELTGVKIPDPLAGDGQFPIILVYNLLLAFGTNTLLYTGAMSDINPSLIESSNLDGANSFQQFIHVYIPMIWPTIVTFIITSMAGLFVEQMQLFSFFGTGATVKTFGYNFYVLSTLASAYDQAVGNFSNYSELAALGVLVTVILIPIVLIVRKLLLKYGPSTK